MKKVIHFLLIALLLLSSQGLYANDEVKDTDYYDSYFLFKFTSRGYILTRDLSAYSIYNDLFISLEEFSDAVYFPIDVSGEEGIAKGTFVEQEFYLDLKNKEFFIDSEERNEDLEYFKWIDQEIFISTELARELFKMHFVKDINNLTLDMNSELDLPVYVEIDMKKRKKNFKEKQSNNIKVKDKTVQKIDNPYGILGSPVIALQTNHTYQGGEDLSAYNIFGRTDLLYFESDFGFSGDQNETLSQARIRFTDKKNFNSDYIKYLSFGDIVPPALSILGGVGNSRGVFVSNQKENYVQTAENYILEGNAPSGTEIELYRNNFLLAITTADASGRYVFQGLTLDPGVNVFRIVKYSELGKRSQEIRRVTLAGNVKKGELKYQAFVGQPGKSLLDGFIDPEKENEQYYASTIDLNYGLSDLSSLGLAIKTQETENGHESAVQTGIRFSALGGGYYDFGVASYSDNKSQSNLYIGYNFDNLNVVLQRQDFMGYDVGQTDAFTSLSLNGNYSFENNITIGGLTTLNRTEYTGEEHYTDAFQLGSFIGYKGISAENEIRWQEDSRRSDTVYNGQGRLNIIERQHTFRSFLDYTIKEKSQDITFDNIRSVYRYRTYDDYDIVINHEHAFQTDAWNVDGLLSIPMEYFAVWMGAGINDQNDITARLTFNFTMRADSESNGGGFVPNRFADRANARFVAFYDQNQNGIWDQENDQERIFGNAHFKARGNISSTANDDGVAVLIGLLHNSETKIQLDSTSLGDVYLRPSADEYLVTPRLGSSDILPIPVLVYGGIEGIVSNDKEVILSLIDAETKETLKVLSPDPDGYYIFENLPQGTYEVQLMYDPNESLKTKTVTITIDNPFISDVNFI